MSKDRLLSDEELAEKVNCLVGSAVLKNDKNYSWEILDLINTQKRLYAESAIGDDEAEILAKHGAEPGEMTHTLKQAIVEWYEIEKHEVYDSGCSDTAKHIIALFDNELPEQLKQWLRLEIEDRGKL